MEKNTPPPNVDSEPEMMPIVVIPLGEGLMIDIIASAANIRSHER